jgi:sialate O-acetylesterase
MFQLQAEVGRSAHRPLSDTYGKDIVSMGPLYDSYLITEGEIEISFKPESSKLKTSDGEPLKGFSIAGPDRKFYWADAIIKGDRVVVSSPEVPFPIAVRYAWADNPVCNLTNEADLPASPFRTDDWPVLTISNK